MADNASLIDVSIPLCADTPTWPGSTGISVVRTRSLTAGDSVNVSHLATDVHVGTHVDAPLHFLKEGSAVEDLPLSSLVGMAAVVDLDGVSAVTASALDSADVPDKTERLLIRTSNSRLWHTTKTFVSEYVGLTADAAEWVVSRGIRLVGIDYLSVQRFEDGPSTHLILLSANVVVLEGLDLSSVDSGCYELIALPILLVGAEGAPARVLLRPLKPEGAQ